MRNKLVHFYENPKRDSAWRSASLLQSLATSLLLGISVALLLVSAGLIMYYRHVDLFVNIGALLVAETLILIFLVTVMIEKDRKRSIRRMLERSFLNHHVNNALTQISLVPDVADVVMQDQYLRQAITRISEALFRSQNESELASLSLEVDLGGKELNRGREDRERKWLARGA